MLPSLSMRTLCTCNKNMSSATLQHSLGHQCVLNTASISVILIPNTSCLPSVKRYSTKYMYGNVKRFFHFNNAKNRSVIMCVFKVDNMYP